MFKRELVDVSTGKHYVASQTARCYAVGDHVRLIPHQPRRPQHGKRVPKVKEPGSFGKLHGSFGVVGPLLLLAGAVGLFLVLHASSDHLVPVLIGIICIAIAFIGACKLSYDISTS